MQLHKTDRFCIHLDNIDELLDRVLLLAQESSRGALAERGRADVEGEVTPRLPLAGVQANADAMTDLLVHARDETLLQNVALGPRVELALDHFRPGDAAADGQDAGLVVVGNVLAALNASAKQQRKRVRMDGKKPGAAAGAKRRRKDPLKGLKI